MAELSTGMGIPVHSLECGLRRCSIFQEFPWEAPWGVGGWGGGNRRVTLGYRQKRPVVVSVRATRGTPRASTTRARPAVLEELKEPHSTISKVKRIVKTIKIKMVLNEQTSLLKLL